MIYNVYKYNNNSKYKKYTIKELYSIGKTASIISKNLINTIILNNTNENKYNILYKIKKINITNNKIIIKKNYHTGYYHGKRNIKIILNNNKIIINYLFYSIKKMLGKKGKKNKIMKYLYINL